MRYNNVTKPQSSNQVTYMQNRWNNRERGENGNLEQALLEEIRLSNEQQKHPRDSFG